MTRAGIMIPPLLTDPISPQIRESFTRSVEGRRVTSMYIKGIGNGHTNENWTSGENTDAPLWATYFLH
jgi:hypothetical protein